MGPARIGAGAIHVARIVLALWAVFAGRRIGPVVGVEDPAVGGGQQMRRLVQGVQPLPVRRRVRAVHRLGVVEPVVAPWNELRVQIGDLALGVGEDGVVRGVGPQLGDLEERGVVLGLGAQERLAERLDRLLHQGYRDPLAVRLTDDRAVVRAVDGEALARHLAGLGAVGHGDGGDGDRAFLGPVAIEELAVLLHDGLGELIDHVDAA